MDSEFSGKNYIVTGASSGIGQAVCLELSRNGANVILTARNMERLKRTLAAMKCGNHTIVPFEVSDIAGIQNVVNDIYSKCDTIDGFVYCAGMLTNDSLQKATFEKLHSTMLVNYYAFVEFVRCIIKAKSKEYPMRIVGISSLASRANASHTISYSTSKAALEAAVRALSIELVSKNATINAICPSYVDTEGLSRLGVNELYGDFGEYIKSAGQPFGLIEPADVAKMAVYLLGDAAKSITGMNIPINGGARF